MHNFFKSRHGETAPHVDHLPAPAACWSFPSGTQHNYELFVSPMATLVSLCQVTAVPQQKLPLHGLDGADKHKPGCKSNNLPQVSSRVSSWTRVHSKLCTVSRKGAQRGDALLSHQPSLSAPWQPERGRETELDPQGRKGALPRNACSKLLPRSITQPSFSTAERANCIYQLTALSFSHTFLKAASKTKHLLSGGASAQHVMASTLSYVLV